MGLLDSDEGKSNNSISKKYDSKMLRFSVLRGKIGNHWLPILPIYPESGFDVFTFRPRLNVVVEKDD